VIPGAAIDRCRLCQGRALDVLLDLGVQYLTGVFPSNPSKQPSRGPLMLALCADCGLVQLRHSFDRTELYGEHYGYRSSLNQSMVDHLRGKVASLLSRVSIGPDDLVLDVGSNDGTLLSFYPADRCSLVGFDPCITRFGPYYRRDIIAVPEFFSADTLRAKTDNRKAKIITSVAMFYDLEDPIEFVSQVVDSLAADGIWHFEQSYLPLMLEACAYDTICHEHLEYYGLKQIKWLLDRSGLKIIDVELNSVNGGSFAVTACKTDAPYAEDTATIDRLLRWEDGLGLSSGAPYYAFAQRVYRHRDELQDAVAQIQRRGETLFGYGASTKGNVILQFCGFGPNDIRAIADVNADKFGHYTPGTLIPIVSEVEAHAARPDYFLVFPWHFKSNLIAREREYLRAGGKLLFPLPRIEVVTA
jgi:hypothetical protein